MSRWHRVGPCPGRERKHVRSRDAGRSRCSSIGPVVMDDPLWRVSPCGVACPTRWLTVIRHSRYNPGLGARVTDRIGRRELVSQLQLSS